MKAGYYIHTGVAILSVGLAFMAWKMPRNQADEVLILADTPSELTSFQLDTQSTSLIIHTGDNANLEIQNRSKEPIESEKWPASKMLNEALAELLPMKGVRRLGTLSTANLKELGLNDPARKILLKFGDKEEEILLGDNTYGDNNVYALHRGTIYLLANRLLRPFLHGASQLIERLVFSASREDLARITIQTPSQKRELVFREDEDGTTYLANPVEPDRAVANVETFLNRLLRLRATKSGVPKPKGQPAIQITLVKKNDVEVSAQIWAPIGNLCTATTSRIAAPILLPAQNFENLMQALNEMGR